MSRVQVQVQSVENVFFLLFRIGRLFFILCVGGLCENLNKKSEIMLNQLKCGSLDRVVDRKVLLKRVRGCFPIKLRFGSNFVGILTPLRIVFGIKGTVRLLLLRWFKYVLKINHEGAIGLTKGVQNKLFAWLWIFLCAWINKFKPNFATLKSKSHANIPNNCVLVTDFDSTIIFGYHFGTHNPLFSLRLLQLVQEKPGHDSCT